MSPPRLICGCLLLAAFVSGWLADRRSEQNRLPPVTLGGFRVLAADFHVHPAPWSAATISPWDLPFEARRQGLDAFAMAAQNHLWVSKLGRWFSERMGGPTVLVSEEIHTPTHHIIAVGVHDAVDWRLPAASAIAEIHRQGGVAIAAHPVKSYWPGWDAEAMRALDAAEVVHPIMLEFPGAAAELEEFYHRKRLTAIGSSDLHGLPRVGLCRTYVFARENTQAAILDALREGRTVVYAPDGRPFGDPTLIGLAASEPRLKQAALEPIDEGPWAAISRWCAVSGLLGGVLFGLRARA